MKRIAGRRDHAATNLETTTMTMNGRVIATAVFGLLMTAAPHLSHADGGKTKTEAKVKCEGVNKCKGQGSCASAKNSCKGQNGCKGQGWVLTTAKQCKAQGGTVLTGK